MVCPHDWDELLREFRSFGGRAENVVQREGPFGLGLFPINPDEPVQLMVPKALLVPADNVALIDGEAMIQDDSAYPAGYGAWFRRYQATYSWGAEGEASVERFATGLRQLPDDIRDRLQHLKLYAPEDGLSTDNAREHNLRRFLNSRCLGRDGRLFVMPIVELVNHSPSAGNWETQPDGGVAVTGKRSGEVLVKYSNADPLRRLMRYGFNALEPLAFSLFVRFVHDGHPVLVRGGGGRHWFQPTTIERKGDRLVIQQPLLGFRQGRRLPLTLFLNACDAIPNLNGRELFERLHQANTEVLVNLLRQLEPVRSDTADLLRNGCFNQLLALSHHVGHRSDLVPELEEISEPTSSLAN
ncbi:MAG: hypothetical protein CMN95_08610 [Synechococcus sp. MED650]|nr:hypothetical protein [Synechococcus sp. MED650]